MTARHLVCFVRPNGSKQTQHTAVRPQLGEYVEIAAVQFKVRSITCRYEAVDGKQDHLIVHLEALDRG